ncbi:hypothetical protein ABK040_008069 [Willaertia magna]
MKQDEFFVRCYVGHEGRYGHEYLEIIFNSDGLLEYTNDSMYKKDGEIKKQVIVNDIVLRELKKIVKESQIIHESDKYWPLPDNIGKSELEIIMDGKRILFVTSKIQTLSEVAKSRDPEGLKKFYFLLGDLKNFAISLINLHFKTKPVH